MALATTYDFSTLTPGDLNGKDGWSTTKYNTTTDIQVDATHGYDGTKDVRSIVSGGGVGGDASRASGGNLILPSFAGPQLQVFDFDIYKNYWGTYIYLGRDTNGDGKILLANTNEHGVGIQSSGYTGRFDLWNGGWQTGSSAPNAWSKVRLVIDTAANSNQGQGCVLYKNPPDALTWQASTLQAINLNLNPAATDARNPANWNYVFFHFETEAGGLDNFEFSAIDKPSAMTLSNNSIAEMSAINTAIGSLTTNGSGSYAYSLVAGSGDSDNADFTLSGNQLQSAKVFDFERKSSYSIRVRAQNLEYGSCASFEQAFTITITDVNEAPIAGFGGALDFDGVDDFIDLGTDTSLAFTGTSPYTLEAWVYPRSLDGIIISKYQLGVNGNYALALIGQALRSIRNVSPYNTTSSLLLPLQQYSHVATTYDGSVLRIYINGIEAGNVSIGSSSTTGFSSLIGAWYSSTGKDRFLNGQLHEVRVWNSARSAAQIQQAMYRVLPSNESGLIGYWKLNEESGNSATDSTENELTGALHNMADEDWIDAGFSYILAENATLNQSLPAYDDDGDGLLYQIVNDDSGAVVLNDPSSGAFTYTPTSAGTHTFTYQVSDGEFTSNLATATVIVTSLVVNSLADTLDGDYGPGQNTLREAIRNAADGDTITFDSTLSGQTIRLNSSLIINKSLTIDGGINQITLSGDSNGDNTGDVRVFEMSTVNITLANLTIADGNTASYSMKSGAGIWNGGSNLTIRNCLFTRNRAADSGGAISNGSGQLSIYNTTFQDNSATWAGGTITNQGTLTLRNSTISDGSSGGGNGSGIFSGNGSTLHLLNNLIANSINNSDCYLFGTVAFTTNTHNLIEDGSCSASFSGDPGLGTLQNYGGPVQTMALPANSVAHNAGDSGTCETTDARGIARPQNGACDLGAYEKQAAIFTSSPPTLAREDSTYGYTITASDPDSTTPPTISASIIPSWMSLTDNGDGTGVLSGVPSEAQLGTHSVTLHVNQATENILQSFNVSVLSVNDAPSFIASPLPVEQSLATAAKAVTIPQWISTFLPGGSVAETGQVASYQLSNVSNPALFTVLPSVSVEGTLSYTLAPLAQGSTTFSLSVQDNGGTANGGQDTSSAQTFTLNVGLPSLHSVQVSGSGSGRITSPEGIDCTLRFGLASGACSVSVREGVTVLLQAVAEPGMVFTHWRGDCAGQTRETSLVMGQSLDCQAEFTFDRNLDGISDAIQPFIRNQGTVSVIVQGCNECVVDSLVLSDVASFSPPDTTHNFQTPLSSFQISNVPVGGQLGVKLLYEGISANPLGWKYRKFGHLIPGNPSTQTWFDHPAASFTSQTLLGQPMVVATLTFTDGQLGDNSPVDGVIIDPGAPALGRGIIGFATQTYQVNEEDGSVALSVTRTGGSDGALQVTYASQDETAQADSDYTAVSGTLEWLDKDTTPRTISVPLLDDTQAELVKTFSVSVSGADVDLLTASTQITLNPSDQGITLSSESITLREGDSATFTLERGFPGSSVTVHYTTQDGSAQASHDYQAISGDVTWAEGETGQRRITLNVMTNYDSEAEESFKLLFSNALTASATVNIAAHSGVILPSGGANANNPVGLEVLPTISTLSAQEFANIPLAIFSQISAEMMAQIPAESFNRLSSAQLGEFSISALQALSVAQFEQISPVALSGLDANKLPALSNEVLSAFTTEHVEALSAQAMNEMDSRNSSNILVYLDLSKVNVKAVARIVPKNFQYNPQTGDFLPPPGGGVTPRSAVMPKASGLTITKVINMNSKLSVGGDSGQAASFQTQSEQVLVFDDLSKYFSLTQDEEGILQVKGNEEVGNISFAFIPDMDNVVRLAQGEEVKVGLSVDTSGFFHLTLPDGIQFQVTPAPQHYQQLNQVTAASALYQGNRGEIMLSFGDTTTRRRGSARAVGMFDPLIEPPPGQLCVQSASGSHCDFSNAPAAMRPGVHVASRRRASAESEKAYIVYPDGSSQVVRPTVLDPDTFALAARQIDGVETVKLLVDGTLLMVRQGIPYRIVPNFQVTSQEAEPDAQAQVTTNPDGSLRYSLPWNEPEAQPSQSTRRRGAARETLVFTPAIEPIPSSACVQTQGNLRCDFQKLP